VNLNQWLDAIQALHPAEIDLGLERLRVVAQRLGLGRPAPLVITVAGTNGKGSTVAMLEAIFRAAGYRVGTYTSPHILVFNERVHIAGAMASDEALCEAFERIVAARQDVPLTYFEYTTLAGLLLLEEAALDVAILEVGLGGRLDAVNLIDADIAVITSIGLDHQDWLGDTRELIGREKAGIMRPARPAVCGDLQMPESIAEEAARLGVPLYRQGQEFGYTVVEDEAASPTWDWWGADGAGGERRVAGLPLPELDVINAATVLQVLALQPLPVPDAALATGLAGLSLPGRFQRVQDPRHVFELRMDVAHNPHAAVMLASKLAARRKLRILNGEAGQGGLVRAVVAMMADKDHAGYHAALESEVDIWYIAAFDQPRCQHAGQLLALMQQAGAYTRGPFDDVTQAYEAAWRDAGGDDLILVTGSFVTVADVLQDIDAHRQHSQGAHFQSQDSQSQD